MMAILSLLGVACCATAAFVLTSAAEIGALQVILAAIFGFGAFICACLVAVLGLARHTKNKVVNKVQTFRRKKLN